MGILHEKSRYFWGFEKKVKRGLNLSLKTITMKADNTSAFCESVKTYHRKDEPYAEI